MYSTSRPFLATPLQRVIISPNVRIPAYYLSVAARNLNDRKARWEKERARGLGYPVVEEWRSPPFDDPETGLITHVSSSGEIDHVAQCEFSNGLLLTDGGLLSAQHDAIRRYTLDLKSSEVFASFKPFNDLHTLRETPNGILVTTSGTDSIVEISKDGKELFWSWFATEHGYTRDSFGKERRLDLNTDHRRFFYNTWLRTTHVNSALPLLDGSILVTFFHQGILGKLDRESGLVTTVVSDLKRPHAARFSDTKITFVDTGRGIAYRGSLSGNTFAIENSIHIESNWLQDAQFTNGMWHLVDAQNARVYFGNLEGEILAYDQFDTNWDFFEVLLD